MEDATECYQDGEANTICNKRWYAKRGLVRFTQATRFITALPISSILQISRYEGTVV